MKVCANCGKTFATSAKINGKTVILTRRKYCLTCSPYNGNNRQTLEDKPHPNYVNYIENPREIQNTNCLVCGKELEGKQTKYCSDACKFKVHSSYENQRNKGIERKIQLIMMAGGCCSICGYNKNITVLSFHHLDPSTKKFQIDARNISNRGKKAVLREFEKCVLLCANCHAEEHNPDMVLENLVEEYFPEGVTEYR